MPRLPNVCRIWLAACMALASLTLHQPVHAAAVLPAPSTVRTYRPIHTPAPQAPAAPRQSPAAAPADEPPALVLTIDDGLPAGLSAVPGATITYTLVFTNLGDSDAINVQLAAVVPTHTRWVSDTESLWTCPAAVDALASPVCRTGIASLGPHTPHQVDLAVRVDDPLPADVTTIRFDASVNADNVICGECGQGAVVTPVDPDQPIFGDYRLFIPRYVSG